MIKQLIVKIDNKPGSLNGVVSLLSDQEIDIKALEVTARGSGDHGEVHVIVSNVSKAIQVLGQSQFQHNVEEVVVVEMDDQVGGLASILGVLDAEKIDIRYLYAFVGRLNGKSLAVIGVDNITHAENVLAGAGVPLISQTNIDEQDKLSFKPSIEDHFGDDFIW